MGFDSYLFARTGAQNIDGGWRIMVVALVPSVSMKEKVMEPWSLLFSRSGLNHCGGWTMVMFWQTGFALISSKRVALDGSSPDSVGMTGTKLNIIRV
jgi:hypothetical protein